MSAPLPMHPDVAAADRLRAILQTARDLVIGLHFEFGVPTDGYDKESVIATLNEMLPPEGAALARRIHAAEAERSREVALDCDEAIDRDCYRYHEGLDGLLAGLRSGCGFLPPHGGPVA